jgi:hypothetical protein
VRGDRHLALGPHRRLHRGRRPIRPEGGGDGHHPRVYAIEVAAANVISSLSPIIAADLREDWGYPGGSLANGAFDVGSLVGEPQSALQGPYLLPSGGVVLQAGSSYYVWFNARKAMPYAAVSSSDVARGVTATEMAYYNRVAWTNFGAYSLQVRLLACPPAPSTTPSVSPTISVTPSTTPTPSPSRTPTPSPSPSPACVVADTTLSASSGIVSTNTFFQKVTVAATLRLGGQRRHVRGHAQPADGLERRQLR